VASRVSETVVITTEDLEPAVRLRNGFEEAGFDTELLTAGENLADARGDAALVVITGGVRERRARSLISAARERGGAPVIGLVEPTDVPGRELCRRLGISECFAKPADIDEVVLVGRRLIERERLRRVTGIVGETDVMEEVLERVVQIASVDSTVLIQGESGTGKELVARGIHALSARRHRPFIPVNVAALPENLIESELFGHEKGAFTGASSLRKGLFELANTGTIFLDEIGDMPLSTQTKLLRVLEEREFRRVGGERQIRVDVRVIAATNRNLRERVEAGDFRRDLYHRLNVLRIEIPALRERPEDIPKLIHVFVDEFSATHDRPFPGIDAEALRMLTDYAWPGNVRELRNLIESMVVLAPGRVIRPADIPHEVRERRGSLLPVPVRRPAEDSAPAAAQIEFILRTIFDLRMDVEDIRREMDRYRNRLDAGESDQLVTRGIAALPPFAASAPADADPEHPHDESAPDALEEGAIVFRPGMKMHEIEREAISAALRSVRGNRRRAAEVLGIGERTLYRKIKEFERG
jgi:DNA-binding NtrC family response regulator